MSKEQDKHLNEMLARAFPNGVAWITAQAKPLNAKQEKAKAFFKFLEHAGFRLVDADTVTRTAKLALFVGDPSHKRGVEIIWGFSVDAIGEISDDDLLESLTSFISGAYAQGVRELYQKMH